MHLIQKNGNIRPDNLDTLRGRLKGLSLRRRTSEFSRVLRTIEEQQGSLYLRLIDSAADREVEVIDPFTRTARRMLMFGSNNYLGLANHPYIREKVRQAMDRYGTGIGGPPLLNGYTILHRQLEERLADLKGTADALVFSSGYNTNLGLLTALIGRQDTVICDACSHASFYDGMRMQGSRPLTFDHNDLTSLARQLEQTGRQIQGDLFVGIEGVYSMDGDLAPLDKIVPLCRRHRALLILDDAHGTGVMGPEGRGTAHHFGLEDDIDITMGTFSKTFAVVGGFVAADRALIDYLRFFARSYMFSASLPPLVVAAVLAGLDVIQKEPELRHKLRDNVQYAARQLRAIGFATQPEAAIIPLRVPVGMDIRRMAFGFHQQGIFLNAIEYPAVPADQQRFRISLMASHSRDDIDRLVGAVQNVWLGEQGRENDLQQKMG